MAYKYSNGQVFKVVLNDKTYNFTCFAQGTSYGFRHVCYEGLIAYPYRGLKPLAKCNYLNRTWECWQYQSVLREAIEKLYKKKDINEGTYNYLIDSLINRNHTDSIKIDYIRHIIDSKWLCAGLI